MESYFGLDEPKEEFWRNVNSFLSDYGIGLNILVPGLAALIAPLNKLRLMALSPTIFEYEFLKLLKYFVKFREEDFFIPVNNEEIFPIETDFHPKNEIFTFHSIYPKIKVTFIALRIITTVIFCLKFGFFARKSSTSTNHLIPKNKFKIRLINLLIRATLSLDHINIIANSLYLFTSLYKPLNLAEILLIMFDLFLISIF